MMICHDCQKDTDKSRDRDYYMVTDKVWEKYGVGRGYLCIECLEKRMGRKLEKKDIHICPATILENKYTSDILGMKYILGIRLDGTYRDSLSYSGWNLWKTSKESYRKRYYENEKPFETVETIFGKHVGDLLENNDESLKHIPRYDTPEKIININIDGAKFNGRLDTFCSKTFAFRDYKTSHADKDGKIQWNKVKVAKLKQLNWYSWLVKEKYGKVKNLCHLDWLETEFKNKSIDFQGMTLEAQTRELRLTGKHKKFGRTIQEWERKKIREEALLAIREISEDFAQYIKNGKNIR